MKKSRLTERELVVVGDRLLIVPDASKERTPHGLYLPQGVEEKEKVASGFVFKKGPGYPIPEPGTSDSEPWSSKRSDVNYMPLQVEEGDHVIYMRRSAIEIEIDGKKYVIVPYHAVLLIIRENLLNNIDDSEKL